MGLESIGGLGYRCAIARYGRASLGIGWEAWAAGIEPATLQVGWAGRAVVGLKSSESPPGVVMPGSAATTPLPRWKSGTGSQGAALTGRRWFRIIILGHGGVARLGWFAAGGCGSGDS